MLISEYSSIVKIIFIINYYGCLQQCRAESPKKILILAILGVIGLVAIGVTIWGLKQRQETRSSAGSGTILKEETFESAAISTRAVGTFYVPNQSAFQNINLTNNVQIVPDTENPINPTKILTLSSNAAYMALETKVVEPATYLTAGDFEIMFWDDPSRSYKVLYSVMNNNLYNSSTNYASLGIDPSVNANNYILRNKGTSFDTGFIRTKGWHTFKFHVTEYGTTAFIDNQPLSWLRAKLTNGAVTTNNTPIIYDLKSVNYASIESWGGSNNTVASYWDNFKATKLTPIGTNVLSAERNLFTSLYNIYGNSNGYILRNPDSGAQITLKWDRGTVTGNNKGAWYKSDPGNVNLSQAMIAAIAAEKYSTEGNTQALKRSQDILLEAILDYNSWGKRWDSPITMYTLLLTASMQKAKGSLQSNTATYLKNIALEEANFWMTTNMQSIQYLGAINVNGRNVQCNIRTALPLSNPVNTTDPNYTACIEDNSLAEENSWISAFFIFLADMYPNESKNAQWKTIGEQTAYAAYSKNETVPGTSFNVRTVQDNYYLANHGLSPHPSYMMTVSQEIGQGLLYKINKGQTISSNYYHNMDKLWSILGQSVDWNTYNYKAINASKQSYFFNSGRDDWGLDATAQNGAFAYLAKMYPNAGISMSAVISKQWYWRDGKLPYPIMQFNSQEQLSSADNNNKWNSNSFYFLNCMIAFDHLTSYMINNPTAVPLSTLQ